MAHMREASLLAGQAAQVPEQAAQQARASMQNAYVAQGARQPIGRQHILAVQKAQMAAAAERREQLAQADAEGTAGQRDEAVARREAVFLRRRLDVLHQI